MIPIPLLFYFFTRFRPLFRPLCPNLLYCLTNRNQDKHMTPSKRVSHMTSSLDQCPSFMSHLNSFTNQENHMTSTLPSPYHWDQLSRHTNMVQSTSIATLGNWPLIINRHVAERKLASFIMITSGKTTFYYFPLTKKPMFSLDSTLPNQLVCMLR